MKLDELAVKYSIQRLCFNIFFFQKYMSKQQNFLYIEGHIVQF